MISELKNLTSKQIASEIRDNFLPKFFEFLPDIKNNCAVLITGSIGYQLYDNNSDIDISIILSESLKIKYNKALKDFKSELKNSDRQLQIFYNTTLEDINNLLNWGNDLKLREYSEAIIIHDANNRFRKLQKQFLWYPKNVALEKINWLFAETIFEFEDRFKISLKRGDLFYANVSKLVTLQLCMTYILLINKKYPIYDKHLYRIQKKLKTPKSYLNLIKRIVQEVDLMKSQALLQKLIVILETELSKLKLIPRGKDTQYWIDLRPAYTVKLK